MVLITYDVETLTTGGKRRLRQIAKLCENHGQRVQLSVFECLLEPAQWTRLRTHLLETIDPSTDSLRFYFLGANWQRHIEHAGAKPGYNPEGPLVL
ncbi:MAG TPA: CRISPR-associated endonuclease Cas2 [Bryobacteraceae bacterium]|nr:CRISPR-associated endonuclease Cas2 [Bryobacteraceae bacterium]